MIPAIGNSAFTSGNRPWALAAILNDVAVHQNYDCAMFVPLQAAQEHIASIFVPPWPEEFVSRPQPLYFSANVVGLFKE
jgi:hypothetical protein